MRKNIRRSLVVAATASGIWALGAASASAAELPVTHDAAGTVTGAVGKAGALGTTHKPGTGALTETLHGVTDTVQKTTEGVTRKLPSKGIPENGLPTNTLPTDGLPAAGAVSDTVDGVTGLTGRLAHVGDVADAGTPGDAGKAVDRTGRAGKALKEARLGVAPVTGKLPVGTLPVHTLPVHKLPVHTLPAHALPVHGLPALPSLPHVPSVPSAPAAGDLVSGLAGAGLRPEGLTVLVQAGTDRALATVGATVSGTRPTVDQASATVLPAFGRSIVVTVRPVADQAVTDVRATADHTLATGTPFAAGVARRAHCLSKNVTGDVAAFGQGAVTDAVPFAQTAGAGLNADVTALAQHAASGVQIDQVVPAPADLTGVAGVPALPDVPGLPTVPSLSAVPQLPVTDAVPSDVLAAAPQLPVVSELPVVPAV